MAKEMITKAADAFNWKKHPANVFWIAIPLATMGFAAELVLAVLQLQNENDPWYLVIITVAMVFLAIAIWPIRKQLKDALSQGE